MQKWMMDQTGSRPGKPCRTLTTPTGRGFLCLLNAQEHMPQSQKIVHRHGRRRACQMTIERDTVTGVNYSFPLATIILTGTNCYCACDGAWSFPLGGTP